uniref:BZIP domain-containing protein n=1 Tax=Odontella aurita TaxID=265563 RepID=A0A7S4J7Q0_9STRA
MRASFSASYPPHSASASASSPPSDDDHAIGGGGGRSGEYSSSNSKKRQFSSYDDGDDAGAMSMSSTSASASAREERRLEQNRIRARETRKRDKVKWKQMENTIVDLKRENEELKAKNEFLVEELEVFLGRSANSAVPQQKQPAQRQAGPLMQQAQAHPQQGLTSGLQQSQGQVAATESQANPPQPRSAPFAERAANTLARSHAVSATSLLQTSSPAAAAPAAVGTLTAEALLKAAVSGAGAGAGAAVQRQLLLGLAAPAAPASHLAPTAPQEAHSSTVALLASLVGGQQQQAQLGQQPTAAVGTPQLSAANAVLPLLQQVAAAAPAPPVAGGGGRNLAGQLQLGQLAGLSPEVLARLTTNSSSSSAPAGTNTFFAPSMQ